MGEQAGNGPAAIAPHRLSTVVSAIYDCAIDPNCWPHAIREICADLRCMHGAIYLFDAESSHIRHVKASDRALELDIRNKAYEDEIVAFLRLMPVATQPLDEPLLSTQLDHGNLFNSRYFREVSLPQGHHDSMHVVLARNGQRFGLFSATRHKSVGFFSGDDFTIMRLFAPHIRRAVTISDLMELRALETEALSATLDRLALGVVVVASDHRILHANEAARHMLANGGRIASQRGRLAARDAAADAELARAIELARSDEAALGAAGIGVSLGSADTQPTLAHVLPLARGEVRTRLMPQATAAVFISTPEPRAVPDLRALAQTYGLTAAEARVAERLLAGAGSLADVATSLDVSLATVKTHLSQVFAKTGVSRQSDLIALMHRMAVPVQFDGTRQS